MYRTLSTAGITAATFAHESAGSPLKVMHQAVPAIERRGIRRFGEEFSKLLGEQLRSLRRAISSLAVLGSVTLSLIEADKRRMRRVELHSVIEETTATFQPFFDQRRVVVDLHLANGEPYLRASRAALESILTNLINNSLIAFERKNVHTRRIRITTEILGDVARLCVDDNGPGIVDISINDIWLPGQTSRENGTGLGLTIVRDAVVDLGGKVSAAARGDLGGASFAIELPILGVS